MGSATGSPTYVMAHRMCVRDGLLDFPDAFLLASLYVAEGLTPFKVGRGASVDLRRAKRLTTEGWLVMEASPDRLVADTEFRVKSAPAGIPDFPYTLVPVVTWRPSGTTQWWARLSDHALEVLDGAWVELHSEIEPDLEG